MPIVQYPEDRPALGTFGAVGYKPVQETEVAPDTATLLGAAFRQDNTIGSMASNKLAGVNLTTREDGFTGDVMWEKIKATPYEKNWDRFANVFNAPAFEAMKAQIDMETEDRRTIEAAGWWGTGASALAGVVDVPSLIPGGALVREATVGATIARTAIATGAAGALGAGVSEIALQASQQTRPLSESAMAVGGGAILSTLLGAGAGALFTHAERATAMKSIENALKEHVPTPDQVAAHAEGLGAAAVDAPVLGDYGIASGAKSVGALQSGFNPLLRAAHSPSAVHRSIMAETAETGYYLERNVRGEGSLAVESAVKYWDRGALTKGLEDMRSIYANARKAEALDMTPEEFRTAVSKAMRRGDVGEHNAVSAAAQSWRKTLFDPLKNEAIDAGLLPADVNVKTAVSYLTRLWNSPRLNAGEARFKEIVKPWIDDQLSQLEFKADEIRVGNRIVDAEKKREAFGKVSERLDSIESRLSDRQGIRERKQAALGQLRQTRLDVLKERAPADVVKMLRGADENAVMVDTVKQARAAERSANKKMESIRSELGGNPLRTAEEEATAAALDNLDKVAAEWLDRVGLAPNASVKDVRDFIGRVTGAERNTEGVDTRISRFEQEIEEFDRTTDGIANEGKITGAEAKTVGEELEKLETELDAVRDLANSSPRVALVVDYGTTRRDLFKSKLKERTLSKRVDALKRLDAEGAADDDILAELAAKSIELDRLRASIDGLKVKADKLEPMMPKVKQEIPEFVSPADRADYVGSIVDDIFSQLTGRANQGMPSYDMTMSSRGPLKERTFNIPDHLIEEFLEHDIELIGRRYARVMAADVELTRMDKRLGGAGKPTLASQIDRVKNDYLTLREAVHAGDFEPKAREAALKTLAKSEKSDVEDIGSVRDLLRGQYKVDTQHTNYARVLRMAGVFNFMRSLGGVVVSSLSDAARPPMVHGMGRYMSEGIAPLVTNLKAVKLAVEDAKLLGAVTERTLQSRIATMAELADPYASHSPFERFIDNAANVFSKMTLLPWWNDMHKSIASVLVQNRLLKNAAVDYEGLAADELKYMGFLGIDAHMAERISKQFAEFGDVDGNVHIPGIAGWTDEGARRAFAGAVNKDVDSIIVTKSVADVPLFAHTPTGRALLQFKSFALASNQRVLMRGLQEGPGSFITGTMGMTAFGMLTYYLKQVESNRELNDNPGRWIAEGIDRSGVFQLAFEVNNTWEKLGGSGIYNLAGAAFPNATQRAPASRYANRDAFGALLGPSFQLGTDMAQMLGIGARATHGDIDLKDADINRMVGLTPFATMPYWRWAIEGGGLTEDLKLGDYGLKPQLKQAVAN